MPLLHQLTFFTITTYVKYVFKMVLSKPDVLRMCTKYPRLISVLVESVFPNVMRTRWMSELEFNEKSENDRVKSIKEKSAIRHIEMYVI